MGVDHNFVIFGHNMNNETMFGSIVKYKNQEYYDAHPSLYYFMADHIYRIELDVYKRQRYVFAISTWTHPIWRPF